MKENIYKLLNTIINPQDCKIEKSTNCIVSNFRNGLATPYIELSINRPTYYLFVEIKKYLPIQKEEINQYVTAWIIDNKEYLLSFPSLKDRNGNIY